MEFKIMIDQFEGPLDLMLHLIRENKLEQEAAAKGEGGDHRGI